MKVDGTKHRQRSTELLDRQPPCDEAAEKALLGSLMLDGSRYADVATVVRPADFRVPCHRHIFEAIAEIHRSGAAGDHTLLAATLKANGHWRSEDNLTADAPDMAMLIDLFETEPHAANAIKYACIIARTAAQRRIVYAGWELVRLGHDKQRAADDISGLLTEAKAVTSAISAGTDATAPRMFERITSAELDSGEYEQEFLVEGVLVAAQPCVLAGAKKSLKTSLLIDLGLSLAVGGFFLGKLNVPRACRVAIMSGESGLPTIQETARRICHAAGHELGNIDNLIWSNQLPRFGNAMHMEGLRRFLADDAIAVVIIDPAYLCIPANDVTNLFAQGELLQSVNELCQSMGVTLLLAHHCRKNVIDPTQPPELEDISHSGFQEYARQWMLVGRRAKYEPGSGHHRLWLNVGGSAGHSALWAVDIDEGVYSPDMPRRWDVRVMTADEARSSADAAIEDLRETQHQEHLDRAKRKILDVAVRYPDGESKRVLRDLSAIKTSTFNVALAALLEAGELKPCQLTKGNNRSYEGYRISQ